LIARIALLSPHTVLLPTEQGNDKTKSGKEIAMALDKSIFEMVFLKTQFLVYSSLYTSRLIIMITLHLNGGKK
jgi:hypothetical protein